MDLPDWRNDVFHGFVHFIQKEVGDSFAQLLDQCNRRLASLLTHWKSVAGQNAKDKVGYHGNRDCHGYNGLHVNINITNHSLIIDERITPVVYLDVCS